MAEIGGIKIAFHESDLAMVFDPKSDVASIGYVDFRILVMGVENRREKDVGTPDRKSVV